MDKNYHDSVDNHYEIADKLVNSYSVKPRDVSVHSRMNAVIQSIFDSTSTDESK